MDPPELVKEVEKNGGKAWTVERGIDISEYQESVEWDLMSVIGTKHANYYPCCDYPYVDITYYINIRRKTLFYTVNLIIPCVGITFLTALVFYLPSDSNNKITLCVSVLVSLTVFFLLLIEIMPPTSLTIPLIGRYLLFTMVLVTFSICLTVLTLNIHYHPAGVRMPRLIRKVFLEWLAKLLRFQRRKIDIKRNSYISDNYPVEFYKEKFAKNGFFAKNKYSNQILSDCFNGVCAPLGIEKWKAERELEAYKEQACRNVCFIAFHLKKKEEEENIKEDWKFVAMVIDRLFLLIFSVTILFGTIFIVFSAPILRDTRIPITKQSLHGSENHGSYGQAMHT